MANDPKKKTEHANQIIKAVKKSARKGDDHVSKVGYNEIAELLQWVDPIFRAEPMLVEVPVPVHICGDIHGQVHDLVRMFDHNLWPPDSRYLFLGDYVDRGPQNVDTIVIMFAMKVLYPTTFFMIRGNHETKAVNSVYGFKEELQKRFPPTTEKDGKVVEHGKTLWLAFNQVFAYMPLAALVGGRILCMHGGLSPNLKSLDQIRKLERPIKKLPDEGLEVDLLWADPDPEVKGFVKSRRGVSYLFGPDAVVDKCEELNIDLVARAHQVVHKGFDFFTDQLVTLFSAPDYCKKFDNDGGVMFVDANMGCRMRIVRSVLQMDAEAKEKNKGKGKPK